MQTSQPVRQYRRYFLQGLAVVTASAPIAMLYAQRAAFAPTGSATEGPFYVSNTPRLANIARGLSGQPMRVSGQVLGGADANTPLAGVRVEIWHCDAAGDYHPNGNGDISRYPAEAVNLRGHAITDAQGRFAFDSIVPAAYGNRRRHIHWRFTAPGHRVLTTQSYWQDEQGTARALRDFTDRSAEAARWLTFRTSPQGVAEGFFSVRLQEA